MRSVPGTALRTVGLAGLAFLTSGLTLPLIAQNEMSAPARRLSSSTLPSSAPGVSSEYRAVQQRLATGWNTWDVNSVTTQVLLPEGLAIHLGLKHNTTESGEAFLGDTLIGRLRPNAERVFPGPHAWNGRYTDLSISWSGHNWRVQSAQDGADLVLLATPQPDQSSEALPPTIVFSVNFLWNRKGTVLKRQGIIETQGASGEVRIYCTCESADAAPGSRFAGAHQ